MTGFLFLIETTLDAFHQCWKLISYISWDKYVSSALTFCTVIPKGQSMPTEACWQICGYWRPRYIPSCFVKACIFRKLLRYLFYLSWPLPLMVLMPHYPFFQLDLSSSGQRLGLPDYNFSIIKYSFTPRQTLALPYVSGKLSFSEE